MKFTFPKSERLHSKKLIQELFNEGSSFYLYPFKIIFLPKEDLTSNQVLVSVSKKKFKKAVTRNKIKRLIKEAYRLNKHSLDPDADTSSKALIGYIYTGKEVMPFDFIESKLKKSLLRLRKELVESKDP
ncbi:ribonuclease P protein component [Roseivirga misakiensis]|uniref:Ribonuclease P protein component n=1 Tax=Roseivirga misakiensis TaxID=1563681 RepID=A0A1E5T746_9BACT|nr:ribonuclease P protein component [Roseivirga misakiensis]